VACATARERLDEISASSSTNSTRAVIDVTVRPRDGDAAAADHS